MGLSEFESSQQFKHGTFPNKYLLLVPTEAETVIFLDVVRLRVVCQLVCLRIRHGNEVDSTQSLWMKISGIEIVLCAAAEPAL